MRILDITDIIFLLALNGCTFSRMPDEKSVGARLMRSMSMLPDVAWLPLVPFTLIRSTRCMGVAEH